MDFMAWSQGDTLLWTSCLGCFFFFFCREGVGLPFYHFPCEHCKTTGRLCAQRLFTWFDWPTVISYLWFGSEKAKQPQKGNKFCNIQSNYILHEVWLASKLTCRSQNATALTPFQPTHKSTRHLVSPNILQIQHNAIKFSAHPYERASSRTSPRLMWA